MVDEKHHERMEIILSKDDSFLASMLCYISGFVGDDPLFHKAFESALENTIN